MSQAQQQSEPQRAVLHAAAHVERVAMKEAEAVPVDAKERLIFATCQGAAVALEATQHNYLLLSPPEFQRWMREQITAIRAIPV